MTDNEHIAYQLIARLDENDVLDAAECAQSLATFLDEIDEAKASELVTAWLADAEIEAHIPR